MSNDYRRALVLLVEQGYKLKKLQKEIELMRAEKSTLREEARASHEMKSHHPYIPGVDGP